MTTIRVARRCPTCKHRGLIAYCPACRGRRGGSRRTPAQREALAKAQAARRRKGGATC